MIIIIYFWAHSLDERSICSIFSHIMYAAIFINPMEKRKMG